ncbi:probable cytochrome P450 28a5 [Drosophila takahashii]|uniref:probable cytochrome P450 28a5 n=1 Tax=Drosophila takahashii TaxID=29030 RepID=UPI001CF840D3|nr:probable cytochrome P450 28a5 [Drosophila takahashii]
MIVVTLALGLLLGGLLYAAMTWNFNYWRKRRVPGPKPQLFTGNYPNLYTMKRNMIYDLNDIYKKYKSKYDAVGIFSGWVPQLLVISPELAHRVFVTNFKNFHDNELSRLTDEKTDFILSNNPFSLTGEKWKQRRADITPGLTNGRIKSVYPVTNKVCQQMSEWVKKQIRLGAADGINAKDLGLCFTSEMVTDCVLGLSADSFTDKPTPIMANIKDLFNPHWTFMILFALVNTFPSLSHLIKLRFVPHHVERFFIGLMGTAVQSRKSQLATGHFKRTDFLDYLMQLGEKRNLDTRHLLAHTMTFLLDGFETVAGVLSHMLLLLGRDEEVQQRLRDEIQEHLQDGIIPYDKLNELPYLDACLHESIRLFPPGFMTSKLCTESVELPNKDGPDFIVEKGTVVVIPHSCHMMDEEYFPSPQTYNPDRFMDPDAVKNLRERGVYMGFGDGPRICLGMRFATSQVKAAIVELISKFNVRVNPKTRKDNLYDPTLFLANLNGGIWLDMEARQ